MGVPIRVQNGGRDGIPPTVGRIRFHVRQEVLRNYAGVDGKRLKGTLGGCSPGCVASCGRGGPASVSLGQAQKSRPSSSLFSSGPSCLILDELDRRVDCHHVLM